MEVPRIRSRQAAQGGVHLTLHIFQHHDQHERGRTVNNTKTISQASIFKTACREGYFKEQRHEGEDVYHHTTAQLRSPAQSRHAIRRASTIRRISHLVPPSFQPYPMQKGWFRMKVAQRKGSLPPKALVTSSTTFSTRPLISKELVKHQASDSMP